MSAMEVNLSNKEKSMVEVISHLEEGIHTIKDLSLTILNNEGGKEGKYDELRTLIIKMKDNFEQAEQSASGILASIDKECEELTQQKGKLQRQLEDKKMEWNELLDQFASQENMLRDHKKLLANEEENLKSRKAKVHEMRRRMEHDEAVRNTGIGLMFIPLVGTLVGGGLYWVYQKSLNSTKNAKNQAQREIENLEHQLTSSAQCVSVCQTEINQMTQEISQVNSDLKGLDRNIVEITKQRFVVADVQEKFRNAVRVLTDLAGKAKVGEIQTRKFIVFQPLMTVLEETLKCVLQMSEKKGQLQCDQTTLKPIQSAFEQARSGQVAEQVLMRHTAPPTTQRNSSGSRPATPQADTRSSRTLRKWASVCRGQVLRRRPQGPVQPLGSPAMRILQVEQDKRKMTKCDKEDDHADSKSVGRVLISLFKTGIFIVFLSIIFAKLFFYLWA